VTIRSFSLYRKEWAILQVAAGLLPEGFFPPPAEGSGFIADGRTRLVTGAVDIAEFWLVG